MAAAGKMIIQTSYQGLDYHGRDIGAGGYQTDLGRRISLIHQIYGNQAGKKGKRAKITCIHAEITDIMIPRKIPGVLFLGAVHENSSLKMKAGATADMRIAGNLAGALFSLSSLNCCRSFFSAEIQGTQWQKLIFSAGQEVCPLMYSRGEV